MKDRSTFEIRMSIAMPLWVINEVTTKDLTALHILGTGFAVLGITAAIDFAEFVWQRKHIKPAAEPKPIPDPPLVRIELVHDRGDSLITTIKLTTSKAISVDLIDNHIRHESTCTIREKESLSVQLDRDVK